MLWRILVWNTSTRPFGERSLVESVFSSLKQRIRIFFCLISSFIPVRNWNLFCKLFMLYYNRLRWVFVLSGHVRTNLSKNIYRLKRLKVCMLQINFDQSHKYCYTHSPTRVHWGLKIRVRGGADVPTGNANLVLVIDRSGSMQKGRVRNC